MATRAAPGMLQTSRSGRGRICNWRRNTPDTRASMAPKITTTAPDATPAPTTQFIWMRESFSDPHARDYHLRIDKLRGEQRDEVQSIRTRGADSRIMHQRVGRRYRRQSYWNEGSVRSLRRGHCGQDVSCPQRAPGHGSKGASLCAAHHGGTTGHNS